MHVRKSVATALLFASAVLAPGGGALAETGTRVVKATWYCDSNTASGERMNCRAMTAAHRSLPFGTRVRVRNLRNNRIAMLRINDRGPAAWTGNGLDVSPAGRDALRLDGKAPVSVTVVRSPADAYAYYPKLRRRSHRRHRR